MCKFKNYNNLPSINIFECEKQAAQRLYKERGFTRKFIKTVYNLETPLKVMNGFICTELGLEKISFAGGNIKDIQDKIWQIIAFPIDSDKVQQLKNQYEIDGNFKCV